MRYWRLLQYLFSLLLSFQKKQWKIYFAKDIFVDLWHNNSTKSVIVYCDGVLLSMFRLSSSIQFNILYSTGKKSQIHKENFVTGKISIMTKRYAKTAHPFFFVEFYLIFFYFFAFFCYFYLIHWTRQSVHHLMLNWMYNQIIPCTK